MSIILIDDVLFNDNEEQRVIRYNNCIFFLVLNGISIFSGLFYLYFYFVIPYYQNSSNSLALFLNIFHLISNSCYFLIFFELYLYEPLILSITIKIIAMLNPLIILCIYYWSACITHNLYVTYYNYSHNMDKRIKFYKYLLFIISVVFYLYTLFNIHYNDSQLLSKSFTFISNYTISFLEFFYICGLFMIIYIMIKLYYVLSKKEDFISVNEYQENEERNEKIKNIFNSVISRNISFVCYFLITFTPTNIIMIIKYLLGKTKFHCYYIDYIVIMLISFNGTFLFFVRLFDPLMRNFILNLFLFNREFITKYKEHLLNEKRYNESLTEESLYIQQNETINESLSENKTKIVEFPQNFEENKIKNNKGIALSLERTKSEEILNKRHKSNKKYYYSSILTKKASQSGHFEMNTFNISNIYSNYINSNNQNQNGDFNYLGIKNNEKNKENENKDNLSLIVSNSNSEVNSLKSLNKINVEDKKIDNDNNNDKNNNIINIKKIDLSEDNEKNNDNDTYFHINSFGSSGKENMNNNKRNVSFLRNNTICKLNINPNKSYKSNILKRNMSLFQKNVRKNNHLHNISNLSNRRLFRANSITSNVFKSKFNNNTPRRHSSSKTIDDFYHEEISSFALMNYHLELNENLIRMIAISISINECRIYDDIQEYQKYYISTIPWENKDFYKEKTLFKEYNDESIPNWIGLKKDGRFTNIQFKVMSYSPFVFHHIRLMDKLSIDDLLYSLNPLENIKKIKKMKVSGGRGNNSLICTWDKKIIIKTIDNNERKILTDKMIIDYHCLMKESKSILSRIYGIFKIELKDKGSINVIVQKNMGELPLETKLLTFDFKGSTVDRQTIEKRDTALNREQLFIKYSNKVLKDTDLGIIGMKFVLNFENWQNITNIINCDSLFLQNLEVTDYSLIVFVHKYRKEDIINFQGCSRIIPSKDNKFIFNFSIVDFLGPFNFEKKGEKIAKSLVGYIKQLKDTNFSVLDPYRYGKRFRNFCKKIIIDG